MTIAHIQSGNARSSRTEFQDMTYCRNTPLKITPLIHENFATSCILLACITIDNQFSLLLLTIYNSSTIFEASTFIQKYLLSEEPIILCGDLNLHAPERDNTVEKADAYTSIFQN